MKRFSLAILFLSQFANHEARGDIPGYVVSTPVLDTVIHPRLVAAAPNGNVWFAQQTTIPYSIGFFTPTGHVTNFPIPCGKCTSGEEVIYVWDIASDRDNSVWFIDNHARSDGTSIDSAIGHLTTSGGFTFFPIPTMNATAVVPNGFGHSSLAVAPDGTIWFTENAAFKAAKLTPSTGVVVEYPLEMPEQPSGIAIGADGKIWYTVADHEIAQITPPSNGDFVEFSLAAGSFPLGLATGTDGDLWITETGRDRIARLKPSGTITEFQPPTSNGVPQHIVAAPDGTLWYADAAGMDVGRITINASSAPAFEAIATPGQQNFDITVAAASSPGGGSVVYVTGGDNASQQDKLLVIKRVCAGGPAIGGPYEITATRTFRGLFSISGNGPLNISIQSLPSSWSAEIGKVTIIDSGASPNLGTYTFTIVVTDGEGCSTSQSITIHIVDLRRRSVTH